MHLTRLELENYRSFGDKQRLHPHERLTVLVGPNESGKSSLLLALTTLRGRFESDDVRDDLTDLAACSTAFRFALTTDDSAGALEEIGQAITGFTVRYDADAESGSNWTIEPKPPLRDLKALARAIADLKDLLPEDSQLEGLGKRLHDYWQLDAPKDHQTDPLITSLTTFQDRLTDEAAEEGVQRLIDLAASRTPFHQATSFLQQAMPQVFSFQSDDRGLEPRYPLVEPAPQQNRQPRNRQPLNNLLALAELDISRLPTHAGKVSGQVQTANLKLRSAFAAIWGEDKPFPQIEVNTPNVDIFVEDPQHEHQSGLPIDRRSAGLRWLVELVSFIGSKTTDTGDTYLLLADEIEQHLHYDAQVDLLDWLEVGIPEAQVICTTHSIGCWPADLGRQMNALQKIEGESRIYNGPYNPSATGSDTLLKAIGASRASFRLNRSVVFCEGSIDEMLLPILFADADAGVDLGECSFFGCLSQTTSSAPPSYPASPGEAFLVDSDRSGGDLRTLLTETDPTRAERVIQLGENDPSIATTEDLLDAELIKGACQEWATAGDHSFGESFELDASQPVVAQLQAEVKLRNSSDRTDKSELSSLKTFIAHHALGHGRDGGTLLRADRLDAVKFTSALLAKALDR